MDNDRVKRLSERFNTIKQSIEELTDADTAFAVASVAFLEAIEYHFLQALRRVSAGNCDGVREKLVTEMHEALRIALKGHHRHLCDHLGVDQLEAIKRSISFKEIVDDICKQRG